MILILFLVLGAWSGISETATTNNTGSTITVDLAIFCDMELSALFNHNQTKIEEYVAVQIFGVNLQFQTLPSVNMKFRVTLLKTFQIKDQQDIIEQHKNSSGFVDIGKVHTEFTRWAQAIYGNNRTYHVALLLTGSKSKNRYSAFYNVACKTNYEGEYKGTLVYQAEIIGNDIWSTSGSLSQALGDILGVEKTGRKIGCPGWADVLISDPYKNRFYFSNCADEGIAQFVGSPTGKCLQNNDPSNVNILPTEMKPPTMKNQCELRHGNKSGEIIDKDTKDKCITLQCSLRNSSTALYAISPPENTPCGQDQSCFRGDCIQDGFQLINQKSGKCLHSTDRFACDDLAHLVKCEDVPSPLDKVIVRNKGKLGLLLATPYSTTNSTETAEKCLTLNHQHEQVVYDKCPEGESNADVFVWEIININKGNDEVLIKHKSSKRCLTMSLAKGSSLLAASSSCLESSQDSAWKLEGIGAPPTHLFTNESVTSAASVVANYPQIAQYLPAFLAVVYLHSI